MRTEQDIIQKVKDSRQLPTWVVDARIKNKHLNALVYGKGYHELLINQIEKIESDARKEARKKYSIDVRDLFYRVMEPRQNVFSADGDSEIFSDDIPKAIKEKVVDTLHDFKGGKSIDEYLSKYLFRFSDVDPNGLIFLEYKQNNGELETVYPTYKSIQDIQDYKSNGMGLEWVIFKERRKAGDSFDRYRFVDKDFDVIVTSGNGGYVIFEEDIKKNDFGVVPAVILSDIEEVGTKTRLSWLFFIEELSKKYARDRSIKTLYEFLQGFPKHWIYANFDQSRRGGGTDGSDTTTEKSDIMGQSMKPDVTDEIVIPVPEDKEYDVKIAPDIGGYISPDLDTLKWMAESGDDLESLINFTMWGTQESKKEGNETATGRWIDTQPLMNKLHVFSDFSQSVHNLLVSYIIRLLDRTDAVKNKNAYFRSYGRRFIIESPDVLMEKYNEARKNGSPTVILDRMLNEWITSKYKNIPELRRIEVLKSQVEPFVHLSFEEIQTAYGRDGVNRKSLFPVWWEEEALKTKNAKELRLDFEKYVSDNKIEIEEEIINQ